jgi:D(-)-tartrate dehydratase
VIQINPPQSYGVVQYFAHARGARTPWLAAQPPVRARRQPDVAGGFGLGGAESFVFGAFGGFADDARVENGSITLSDRPGIGFEGQAALPHHAGTGRHLEKRLG